MTLAGVLQHLNPPQPLSSVGQYTFDGQGNFTRVDFNVGNGVPVNNASTPVNGQAFAPARPDLFNRRGLHWPVSPNANGATVTLQVIVGDFGLSARAIVASEHVPGFPNPPPVQVAPVGVTRALTSWSI